MQNNNPLTEIFMVVVAALLVIGGVVLLYLHTIDAAFASSMFILAVGLLGVNGALKAPSSTQQTQLSNLQGSLQDLLNLFAAHTHPAPTPTPPASPPTQPVQPAPIQLAPGALAGTTAVQPQVQFVPDPSVSMAAYSTSQIPVVTPPAVQP
jgi:hypothetical protein